MPRKVLYKDVTGISNPLTIQLSQSHGNATAVAIVTAENTSLGIGDAIEIDMGYSDNHQKTFAGYVKIIERGVPDDTYIITAYDEMSRAVDYFIASTNPDAPFSRYRVSAEDFIRDLLALAGVTSYTGDTSNFIYGWTVAAEINLVGCYEACKQLSDMLAWHLFADENRVAHFLDRKPYVMPGDVSIGTYDDDVITDITKTQSDDELRNRVVVYGGAGISAEAKSSSPYLPAGFYKTSVLSAWFVDRQDMANKAASDNLIKWNRLRSSLNMTIEGDPSLAARDVMTVQQTDLSINSDWYVYSATHSMGPSGYTIALELRE